MDPLVRFALPNRVHFPAELAEFARDSDIPPDVRIELLPPEVDVGLRLGGKPTPGMLMPEAAVDEHDGSRPGED